MNKKKLNILLCNLILGFVGCKKKHTCYCTSPRSDMGIVNIIKDTKKNAEKKCEQIETDLKVKISDPEVTCGIK